MQKRKLYLCFSVVLLLTSCGTNPTQAEAHDVQSNAPATPSPSPSSTLTTKTKAANGSAKPNRQVEVLKVGEYQNSVAMNSHIQGNSPKSPGSGSASSLIAKIHPHQHLGRQAATLYVRDIPVLTFLAPKDLSQKSSGSANNQNTDPEQALKVGTRNESQSVSYSNQLQDSENSHDPVWRATTLAAQINQLAANDPEPEINLKWDQTIKRPVIDINGNNLVAIDPNTILPDTTKNANQDALQATNRLRRLLSNAPPLTKIDGQPTATRPIVAARRYLLKPLVRGLASWYGPGFHGNLSASGEPFNQNDMTAAHPSLPFGTRVKVTNLNNGRSVVVRINDRGPYVGDRVIDLSLGAAEILGMVQVGVAPVSVDVIQ